MNLETMTRGRLALGEGLRGLIKRLRRENRALKEEVQRLAVFEKLAFVDELTGLHNRRYFEERLVQEMSRLDRIGAPVSVLVVDLDDFKRVNDAMGHLAGDQALRFVASILRRCSRRGDVPCRIGGDEFAVILPDTNSAGAQSFLTRLDEALATAPDGPSLGPGLSIRLSAGMASAPADGVDAKSLHQAADDAMYLCKKSKKARPASTIDHAA